ncbi:MAG: hypothetical protein U5L45_00895 [Saprospiraceae bacterium]|nr:hypothetical protein [Saprospiraceae bacterium]
MTAISTESIKLHLISQIASLNDATVLFQLEKVLNINQTAKNSKNDVLKRLSKPRKKKLDIEALKKEQKFTRFNRPRFDQLIKELDIKEPIEQLLQMI